MKSPTGDRALNPKLLYALAGLVVAALLFLFVVNPLVLGDDGDDGAVVLPVPAAPDRDSAAPDEEQAEPDDDVTESLEVFNARDPFQQLVTTEPGDP